MYFKYNNTDSLSSVRKRSDMSLQPLIRNHHDSYQFVDHSEASESDVGDQYFNINSNSVTGKNSWLFLQNLIVPVILHSQLLIYWNISWRRFMKRTFMNHSLFSCSLLLTTSSKTILFSRTFEIEKLKRSENLNQWCMRNLYGLKSF